MRLVGVAPWSDCVKKKTNLKPNELKLFAYIFVGFLIFWLGRDLPVADSLAYGICFGGPSIPLLLSGYARKISGALLFAACLYLALSGQWKILLLFMGFHAVLTIFILLARLLPIK